jgi:hypothetical protein
MRYCFTGRRFTRVIRCTADMTGCVITSVWAVNDSLERGLAFVNLFLRAHFIFLAIKFKISGAGRNGKEWFWVSCIQITVEFLFFFFFLIGLSGLSGLSQTFKGSSKGSFAFWTIGHHLSRNDSGPFFAHVVSSYSCIGLWVLALN